MQVTLIDYMGADIGVVNAARVSFDKDSDYVWGGDEEGFVVNEADQRLIKYLAKHKHFSPFNHAFASFRVKAPIFVARQLVKHEYLVWNEVSRRYVDTSPEFHMPEVWRAKADNVKQGSSQEAVQADDEDGMYHMLCNDAVRLYEALLKRGVCAEQARMVLPQSMMTEWIWSGSLKAFAKMAKLRLDPHTQAETQVVARMISDTMAQLFPHSWDALLEADIE